MLPIVVIWICSPTRVPTVLVKKSESIRAMQLKLMAGGLSIIADDVESTTTRRLRPQLLD